MGSCLLALALGLPLTLGRERILQMKIHVHASPAPRLLDPVLSERQRWSLHKELDFPPVCRETNQHEGVKLGGYQGAVRRAGGERQIPQSP